MKILKLSLFVSTLVMSQRIFAADNLECSCSGKCLAVTGEQGLQKAEAKFTFTQSSDREGLRTLSNVQGKFEIMDEQDPSDDYVGEFNIPSIIENPDFQPKKRNGVVKYAGYSQYRKFDATKTTPSEGMFGYLVVNKTQNTPTFEAAYDFKASDQLGGVLHLTCDFVR